MPRSFPEGLPCVYIPSAFPDPATLESLGKSFDSKEWYGDMKVSMDYFEDLIRSEISCGTSANGIVLMGYGQGAGMVTLFLLTRKLASELALLAGFPPAPMHIISQMQQENRLAEGRWRRKMTLFILHGKQDIFVLPQIGYIWRAASEEFKERGSGTGDLEWRLVGATGHGISINVWLHVGDCQQKVVPLPVIHEPSNLCQKIGVA